MKRSSAIRVSPLGSHHLVGFNDLDPWSCSGDQLLCLQVEEIARIPTANSKASVGYIELKTGHFVKCGTTSGWNFPQGGRQQWATGSDKNAFLFNCEIDGEWHSKLVDMQGSELRTFQKPIYCQSRDGRLGYGLNYARLYRLGGYGYPGIQDSTKLAAAPDNDGIWETNLSNGNTKLLVSIAETTALIGTMEVDFNAHHYITHLTPSPDGNKLAYLHRYWLPDGGIRTRLVVRDMNTEISSVWDEGFLSHYDWVDDESILIWGKPQSNLQAIRSSKVLSSNPWIARLVQIAKPLARTLLGSRRINSGYFKKVSKAAPQSGDLFSDLLPRDDGHPTFCPSNRQLLLTDTYPDKNFERQLIVVDILSKSVLEIGRFTQLKESPSSEGFDEIVPFIDPAVMKKFNRENFVYSRGGIHCDLHPRWKTDGSMVCFDSNHEGTRQIYVANLSDSISK